MVDDLFFGLFSMSIINLLYSVIVSFASDQWAAFYLLVAVTLSSLGFAFSVLVMRGRI